jgi:transcriptional regulator with XRE-family HTH domain
MQGGDYILMARRRAGLSQRELAERLGCRQATIARWERDDRHPSLEETQAAVRACGFDLDMNLVADDRSWWPQIAVQLEQSPVERLRSLTPPGSRDLIPALEILSEIETPAVVIGEVAGALHGWPLVLSGTGSVEVCGEPAQLGEQLLAKGLTQIADDFAMAAGQRISVIRQPPGTTGPRDLIRGAETIDLPAGSVQIAGVLDLLRIADAADGGRGRRSRETLALQAVLEVERARAAAAPVTATDEERLQAWLDQQPAAA